MHKQRIVSFIKTCITLAIVLVLMESLSFAANPGNSHAQGLQRFVDSGKLPPGIQKNLEKTGQSEILLIVDDRDAKELSKKMRSARGLKSDDDSIINVKSHLYLQKKERVLSKMHPADYKLIRDYEHFPIMHMHVGEKALVALLKDADVSRISENSKVLPHLTESLALINASPAHTAGATGSGTSVAVLDTGVNYTLATFGSCTSPGLPAGTCRVVYAQDFSDENNDSIPDDDGSLDDHGHGTNVSGIVAGVAPDAALIGLDVFRLNGYAYYSDILAALNWVLTNQVAYGIVAVNMSLGGNMHSEECSNNSLAPAISNLRNAGVATVVSSGNNGYAYNISEPACVPGAISVGAVYDANLGPVSYGTGGSICTDNSTAADQVACFSNSASFLRILAPGAAITAAGIIMSGTSQAAPHVAGAVACIKSQEGSLSVTEVQARMEATGVLIQDPKNNVITPRIDLEASVSVTQPILAIEQSGFSFIAAEGGPNPAGDVMDIINAGVGALNWIADDGGASWLSLTPPSGTGTTAVAVDVDTASLAPGTHNATITVTAAGALDSPTTVPVDLEVVNSAFVEDFETGDLTKFPWAGGGSGNWTVQNTAFRTGSFAAQSPAIGSNQWADLQVTLNVTSPGYVYFWVKTSTELAYDVLKFFVDGLNEGPYAGWSGNTDWTFVRSEHIVDPGIHIFKWQYKKDSSVSEGSDAVWVDDIFFPPSNTLLPNPSVAPSSANFGSIPVGGSSAAQTFTVSNTGTGNLIISTVALTGTNASQFTKENDTCSGQTIAPSGTCTVDVKFSPSSTGLKSASLSIPTNYPAATSATLSGTGTVSYTLTANKNGSTGTGTVTSLPAGINCGVDCTEPYTSGTGVTLTATPDANSIFAGWSGGGCSGTGSCAVTLNANTTVTALFNMVPPTADFTGSPVSGDAPLTVSFTDASLNNPSSWSWTFGDGGTSSVQNPVHQYANPGVFTVSLTATNAGGADTMTKTGYITVSSLPVRILGAPPVYQPSLTAAYAAAAGSDTIQSQAAVYTEALDCNRNISITLKGGYDTTFSANTALTTISGSLTVSNGTVTVENISIQ